MMHWKNLLSDKVVGKHNTWSGESTRSSFERDFDRIIFSYPFRRLQDKTQIFPVPVHDFVHSRLTHSLEVSSVGRSLGKIVGEILVNKYPQLKESNSASDFGAIVAAASLTHDLGNPPFGHAGEKAISDYFINGEGKNYEKYLTPQQWQDLTNFEGNAQGFKLLNKKEYQGLKLTYATLLAFSKYPRESLLPKVDANRKSQKKYGFFQSEKEIFQELANDVGLIPLQQNAQVWCRHPLTFLVEAADDICYNIIDLEDGCRLGLVSFEETKDLLVKIIGKQFNPEKLNKIRSTDEKLGVLRAMAIGALIHEAVNVFINNEPAILEGTFDVALTDSIPSKLALEEISKLSISRIYRARTVLESEVAGFEVLQGLLHVFISASYNKLILKDNLSAREKSILRLLPEEYQIVETFKQGEEYDLIMNIIDFIASLTDKYALAMYRNIRGFSLS